MRPGTGRTLLFVSTAAALLLARVALAEAPSDSLQTSRLEVTSDVDSATVYLDTLLAGRTPLILDGLAPGIHVLRILPHRPDEWSVQAVADTVHLLPGETRAILYQLRAFIPLHTDPPGAEVYLNDSLAGITPLLLKPSGLHADTRVVLKMNGFEAVPILPSSLTGETALTVALKASWQAQPQEGSPFIPATSPWNTRRVGLFVSGGVSILAGAGAAYFKIAADDRQEAFLATGDPALASERKRLDTLAGISLVFAQAGIMVLSYLLVAE
jgi:hypothetical protein